jgi:hypothetical protein
MKSRIIFPQGPDAFSCKFTTVFIFCLIIGAILLETV